LTNQIDFADSEKNMQEIAEHVLRDTWMSTEIVSCVIVQCLYYHLSCTAITAHANDSLIHFSSLCVSVLEISLRSLFSVPTEQN
jgi:hypothetical protein